ncbi:MAG: hypothetical protein US83_C0004G0061 [Candidatus Falkowbacteria bacterium GW2011_GWC2_38_22]|uniref:Uncharacterized protein n=1 Tax=Candidatus Falkowbacteria bacterium GW2011_GWE1_38_31 TaxID=1618638 RepID=A0A0G0N0D0_9BACT|nr:MAG: hypothetical protein US73_C0002G0056 [Candidatus Falkowbacteria bacterium GW2011_GWF2_38_1205]KKQ61677.1 MAG: hypothetical protein US83_C0004G0061 [Candidatus Falkowbacteria bacterium GW2011_GWC2_38_22]KKQ63708.1 MAG: hypothetical protein US84_C0004G0056 [Candidatus Falkowbacteria bacterium GW2011_GWF1_38_22]KKQ65876.1 MAG: hypothetical protein US87_C0004G0061 [Candidatus Falkowbacteria bacterium GW2011_GWE2_38_254]KKQ70571.1 MAG: hypothetical protein US91_C0004G0056 [Candidatus Falkowb
MDCLFANIMMGSWLGDYLTQSRLMALTKSEKSFRGVTICFLHCAIYTVSVCLFLQRFDLYTVGVIFLSHFPIDYWSLGQKWLDMIKGRNIVKAFNSADKYHQIDLIFSCIVYKEVDNALHIIIMYLFLQ